jgi:hypothetical protein
MSNFGIISQLLGQKQPRDLWERLIPERWRYWFGPLPAGPLTGVLPREEIRGWGWRIPEPALRVWNEQKTVKIWEKLVGDLAERQVKVVGLDPGTYFYPSNQVLNLPNFPGVSDGKALELLLFLKRFRKLIKNYDIAPQKAKAMIIWEEGNLGIACARLVARELRFLILVSSNTRLLERTAELVVYETGISPQIYAAPPPDYKGARIIIKCGPTPNLELPRRSRRAIWCELFQTYPSLNSINIEHTIAVRDRHGMLPVYPALGEALIRSYFELNLGFWYGSDLPLERVFKLAVLLRELGFEINV